MFNTNSQHGDLLEKMNSLITGLHQHAQDTHKAKLERRDKAPYAGDLIRQSVESATSWQQFAKEGMELAAQFANHGMDLGFTFAYHGMDLGYEFASKGEAVGPMANRILFMSVQIGVMADRIGEMSDRILFMADKIGEFGDKILYESQLIVYTEQLIFNESVLIENTVKTLSDALLDLAALIVGNDKYFEYKMAVVGQTKDVHERIYDNMNLMLRNMHEFSLAMLKKEEGDRERELKERELAVKLRESTMSANQCYCPCFCVNDEQSNPPSGEAADIPPEPSIPGSEAPDPNA
jgi:hypothetical protein